MGQADLVERMEGPRRFGIFAGHGVRCFSDVLKNGPRVPKVHIWRLFWPADFSRD